MTSRIVHQRTGELVAEFPTYMEAASHRNALRRELDPTAECPYAIRTEEEMAETQSAGDFLRDNIGELIATLDAHEAGIYRDRAPHDHYCGCRQFRGTEAEWQQHVAERMAARFSAQLKVSL